MPNDDQVLMLSKEGVIQKKDYQNLNFYTKINTGGYYA